MILITGATGFLGRHITQHLLQSGQKTRLLVRNPDHPAIPKNELVEIAEGDILDTGSLQKAMEGVDQVIHAAAMVTFAKKNYPEMKAVNIQGTANVVNAALESGVNKLSHISSTSATGRLGKGDDVQDSF